MNDIAILHLSDLHIDASSTNYSRLLKGLIADIKKEIINIANKSLVVVVTGDIIHQGEKKSVKAAEKFFEDLYKTVKDKLIGIYLVPGNHDKYRTKENKFLIPAYRMLEANGIKKFDNDFYESFWKYQRDSYGMAEGSGYLELTKKIYEIFGVKTDHLPQRNYIDDTFGVDVLEVQGKKYCFVMLNTAWSCIDENDARNLILGQFQIEEIKRQFHELTDNLEEDSVSLTLVLGHHPIGCLFGTEEDNIFSEMISFEELDANAYLCGHTHDRTVINWVNNRHSINTFMTGIGWPEIKSGYHIGMHTYSMYIFNMDANSIDIYVRSTDDGGSFNPDFRIYTNETNKNNKKIIFPIKAQEAQAYISLGAGPGHSSKAHYISKDFLEVIHEYVMRISYLSQSIGMMIEADKNELFENIKTSEIDEEYELDEELSQTIQFNTTEVLYNYLFADVGNLKEDVKTKNLVESIFAESSEIRYDMFLGFLQRICQKMEKILLFDKIFKGDIVRFHFRYLADRNTYVYLKLCTSFPDNINPAEHELSEIQFGQLIEAAFKSQKGLVYSVNKSFCDNNLKDKWTNFLTVVPLFSGNEFERKYSEVVTKKYPFITFGVTTNSKKFDTMLYCMDFFCINKMLEQAINTYIKIFKIDINKFCDWVKNEMKKEK